MTIEARTRKKTAQVHTQRIARLLDAACGAISKLTLEELQAVDRDIFELDRANCWEIEYQMRQAMRALVRKAINDRFKNLRISREQIERPGK